jgi:hypothetical protein
VASHETTGTLISSARVARRLQIFVIGMLCLHLLLFIKLWDRVERGYPDFTAFYTAGKMLHEGLGRSLYDLRTQHLVQEQFAGNIGSRQGPLPYIHPPFEALLFLPFSLLPYTQAFLAWDLLNGIALFGVSLLLRPHLNALRTVPPWKFLWAFLSFFPVFLNLLQGQDSILLLLLCTLGFTALSKRSDFVSGCWFALGTFKFQFVIPLVLLLAVRGRKRLAAGFIFVFLVLAVLSAAIVGWDGLLHYPGFILHIARTPGLGDVPPTLMPNLRGLLEGWSCKFSRAIPESLTVLISVILLFWTARNWGTTDYARINLKFSLALVVSVLVGWHTNTHDLALLILPVLLVVDHYISILPAQCRQRSLLLPLLPLIVSPLWMLLWFGGRKMNLMAIVLLWLIWEISKELSRTSSVAFGDQGNRD